MPKKSVAAQPLVDVCEDLSQAATAATLPGNPMRWVVLGHFAERILALTEEHRRLRDLLKMQQQS